MNKELTWLHLSDLHFRCRDDNFESQLIYNKLLEDLTHIEKPIDFVFVTGDIAYSGNKKEYEMASEFFKNVIKILRIKKDAIFCVPGNHDIQRTNITNYITKILDNVSSEKEISEIIGQKELREVFLKRLQNYYDFVDKNFFPIEKSDLSYTKNITVNGIDVAIVGLNSAWASNSSLEKGNIVLGERQVIEAFSEIKNPQIIISLLHHPVYYFRDDDVERVESVINNRSDFVLHGHIHNRKVITQKMPDSVVHYLVAGASYDDDDDICNLAYNYVSVDLESGTANIRLRRYDRIRNIWLKDNSYNENGNLQFSLPPRLVPRMDSYILDYGNNTSDFSIIGEEPVEYGGNKIVTESPLDVPSVPKQLLNCLKSNKCVLFAGAGTSMDAKMPSWYELVLALIVRLKEECINLSYKEQEEIEKLLCEGKYMILAAYCLRKLGTYEFSDVLKRKLSCGEKKSLTHEILARIPFRAIITTNFDSFVEVNNAKNGRFYQVLLPNNMDILHDNLDNVLPILKIHGSYENPESIVLNKAGIRELLFHNPVYIETLKKYFIENTVLFYGYSFNDPDIDFILQSIMADKKGLTRKHYAVLPDVGEIEAEYLLQEYNIQVIPYYTVDGGHLSARKFLEKINIEL